MFWNHCSKRLSQSIFVRQREQRAVSKLRKSIRSKAPNGSRHKETGAWNRNWCAQETATVMMMMMKTFYLHFVHCSGDDSTHFHRTTKTRLQRSENCSTMNSIVTTKTDLHHSKACSSLLKILSEVACKCFRVKLADALNFESAAKFTSWPTEHVRAGYDLLAPSHCPGRTVS